jgi:3-(3-hydroxy-phenyl)propionate hydroxylase
VQPPVGGQGLNIGVQDAVNLGWKLAQVVKRTSPEGPPRYLPRRASPGCCARAAQHDGAARSPPPRRPHQGPERHRFRAPQHGRASQTIGRGDVGSDIHYDLGEGHPLLGRRVPDLDLVTANGPLRVFTLLHDARPVLLNLGEFDITLWADRVQSIDAKYVGTWELPAIGAVNAPTWQGDLTQPGLAEALTTWFGPPTEA